MRVMKTFLLIVIALCATGCFGTQYDSINDNAEQKLRQVNSLCKDDMTAWCHTQYALIQRQREQELNDLEARRHAFSQTMQQWGKSRQHRHNVQCTTQVIGNYAYTDCN